MTTPKKVIQKQLKKYFIRKEVLIKQIKGELAFLNSQAVKYLVHEADFGACHENCPSIENRKKKLKKQLKEFAQDMGGEE